MKSFVFCADLQARESIYRTTKELKGDDLFALLQVTQYAQKQGLTLILGGDQVDSPAISDEHVIELRKLLKETPTLYVDGNHERGFRRLSLEGGAAAAATNLEQLDKPTTIGALSVAGLNFRTRKMWEEYLKDSALPTTDILILHGFAAQVVSALGLPPNQADLCDLDLNWFDGKYKLVLLGDIHMYWDWTGPKGTRFIYPGSMWMHRVGEQEDKYFLVVNNDFTVDKIPLTCRPYLNRLVSSEKDLKEVDKWIDAAYGIVSQSKQVTVMKALFGVKIPRVHLTLSNVSAEMRCTLDKLKEKAFIFEKIDISQDSDIKEATGTAVETVDLNSALDQLIQADDLVDTSAAELIKCSVEMGFDEGLKGLKERVGL